MGSDRARLSYDQGQRYRSVVMQQGRVTLEADWNESQVIAAEETRLEALDVVGPAGTPDGGYAVTFPSPDFDFQVGPGTMYVGGVRASLPSSVLYSQQSDWLDNAIDSDWLPVPDQAPDNEYVYLLLREQEVSAVEDADLKDVALGGPDTAQRTRLVQHIVRAGTAGKDCASALREAQVSLANQGLTFDPATMRLNSESTLLVGFTDPGGGPTPCDPTAQGGYLGADNQLIRVQVSSVGSQVNTGGKGSSLVWAYDDASFLYRVDVLDPATVRLQSTPIDAEHQPRSGQTVEILIAAALLANGEYVAAARGFVTPLASGYNPDTQTVTLQDALPAVYGDGNSKDPHPPCVFLRVWQQKLPFTPGTPVPLSGTGIQVTLEAGKDELFHLGDYWMFAVRPSTPQQVYPERYLTLPQPPNGPREWLCPLAVIAWLPKGGGQIISDCRNPFDNLVELTRNRGGGCCTVSVSPADLNEKTTLQTIVDQFRGAPGVNVCFAPGVYGLTQPLNLTSEHSNFTLEGVAGGAVFQAARGSEANFVHGMIVLNAAASVTIRGIRFQLPLVPFGRTTVSTAGLPTAAEVLLSVGLRPVACSHLTVRDCEFDFAPAQTAQVSVGILAAGNCVGLCLERNRFEMQPTMSPAGIPTAAGRSNFVAGFVLLPTTVSKDVSPTRPVRAGATGQVLASFLDDAVVRNNTFSGLTLPLFVYADCGVAELASNTVRNCVNSFWLLTLPSLAFLQGLNRVRVNVALSTTISGMQDALFTVLFHPAVQLATAILRGFPLPEGFDFSQAVSVVLPRIATLSANVSGLQTAFDRAESALVDTSGGAPSVRRAEIGAIGSTGLPAAVEVLPVETFDVAILNQSYMLFERQAFLSAASRPVPVGVHVRDNDISALVTGVASGAGLLVFGLGKDDRDGVCVTGNTLIGARDSGPIALIFGVSRCTFSSNMVLNEAPASIGSKPVPLASLWLFPLAVTSTVDGSSVSAVAVTGNVFRGTPVLPLRRLIPAPPPPMDSWDYLNSRT